MESGRSNAPELNVDIELKEVDALRTLIREAFVAGRAYHANGLTAAHGARWVRARVGRLAEDAPSIFGARGQYRTAGLGTLRYALERGYEDHQARPLVPPSPEKLDQIADEIVSSFFMACLYEQPGEVDEKDLLDPPALRAEPHFSVIDDNGEHRILSEFFQDEDGRLYQLRVIRRDDEVTVFRRYCGSRDSIPVAGGFTETEMNFLALAFAEIRASRGNA